MSDHYELAKKLYDLSISLMDTEFEYGSALIDKAVNILCPDFAQRFSAELDAIDISDEIL